MRAKRVDRNHGDIRKTFRRLGWIVHDLSALGGGMPDLLIVKPFNFITGRRALLVEVKDGAKAPSARRLTPAQVKLHAAFESAGLAVVVIETVEQAEAL